MGFVNALAPLRLARSGQVDKTLSKLASSSFSRIFRLVLPATVATIISWVICNMGLYTTAEMSDAFWLHSTAPSPSPNWLQAVPDLLRGISATWAFGQQNPYDQPQWALIYLLQGSFMIISALFLTAHMTPAWRTATLSALIFWSLNWSRLIGDPWTGLCCFAGIMLAEMSLAGGAEALSDISPILAPLSILVGLFVMSYPGGYPDAASWSRMMHAFGLRFLPTEAVDRMYGSLGGIALVFGIIISPHAHCVLSSKPLEWLGKVSFAIYLLHGMLLRTVFAWLLHLGQSLTPFVENEDGIDVDVNRYPVPGFFQCAFATVVSAACIAAASQVWTLKFDPLFGKITATLEGVTAGKSFVGVKSSEDPVLPTRKD
ncbi:hypothetical protein PV08_00225 [Exophiala spinifera]|uniref:Acyltransferase 3 domain-containing protein n=1 Tax=Exophiala spinifera TaxID=91928 RepID=A0A0D1YWH6_9EURO|nr:uncharacterized protein PV08_00225 [Exophiala spinifera]KIW19651.1 hypothetical protein PV08_00225 [Exophiala spinifera]